VPACRACGDEVIDDPTRGEVCDDGDNLAGDGCAADCRSDEVCGNGVIDDAVGEQCDDGNTNDHDGCQGTCVLQRCGDGVLDRLDDEVCDDGNNGDGDGCAADCRSDETCGNGVVDYLLAEACDDGNELGDDACSASCRPVARWRWRSLSSPPTPAARYDAVVVADPAHDEVLMFGGAGAARFGDTWTWRDRGTDLADAAPAWAPSPRQGAAAAYDVRRGEVILFGGYDAHGVLLDETWAWNGGSWRRVPTAVAPPARRDHAMAWAAELGDGGEVLLFGGAAAEPLGDTWAWDGTAWRALTPASSPPARRGAAVVADPVSGDVVLFGGSADPATFFDDTWRWAAGTWTLAPASGPSGRVDAAMAARPRPMGQATDVLLFGGRASDGAPLGDTWRWDGAAWTELAVSGPPARAGAGLVALPGTDQLLLTGGLAESAFDDDWRWDGSAWTQPDPAEVFGDSGTRVGLDPYRGVVFAERNQTLYARSAAGFVPDLVLTGQGFALGFDNDRRVTVLVEPHEDDEMWIWERADDGWALVHVATVAGGVATNLLSLPGGGVGWLHGTTLRTWDGVTLSAIASFADSPEAWLMGTDLGTGEILMIEPSATVTWNGVTRVEHAGLPPIAAGQESAYNATPHPVTGDLWFLSRRRQPRSGVALAPGPGHMGAPGTRCGRTGPRPRELPGHR
jgi:cysteine-rich repeat protein